MKMFNFCGKCGRALSTMRGFCAPCDQTRRNSPRPQQRQQKKSR